MAAKRKLVGEFDSVSVATSAESATIHGVVSPMHPVKHTKFFEAKLTDRKKVMRSFEVSNRTNWRLTKKFKICSPSQL